MDAVALDARPQTTGAEKRPLWILLGANAVSLAGDRMTALAVPWFVLTTTDSAVKTGLVSLFTFIPVILAAFVGGAIVDRLGPKRTSVLADLLSGATVATIPALHVADLLSLPLLLGLVFAGALLDAPGGTARDTLLPELIERGGLRAERVNGLYGAVSRSASLVGPPLAGVLIGLVGATAVLWIDAATFAVSALAVGLGVPGRLGRRVAAGSPEPGLDGAETGRTVAQLRAGAAFVWRNTLLRTLILVVAFTNLVDAPFGVALAVYVRELLGRPEALGLLFAAHGGCAVAGALVYGAIGHRLPRRPTYAGAFLVVSLSFWLLAATPSFLVATLAMALTGAAAGPINPILMTVLQEQVPAGMRGRVFGAVRAIAWSAMPVGVLAGSALIESIGTGPTFAAGATGYLIAGGFLALTPALRRMNRAPTPATS